MPIDSPKSYKMVFILNQGNVRGDLETLISLWGSKRHFLSQLMTPEGII